MVIARFEENWVAEAEAMGHQQNRHKRWKMLRGMHSAPTVHRMVPTASVVDGAVATSNHGDDRDYNRDPRDRDHDSNRDPRTATATATPATVAPATVTRDRDRARDRVRPRPRPRPNDEDEDNR
jgi:hypothetical protein